MTYDELMACDCGTPVLLKDGAHGTLEHFYTADCSIGVRVPGEVSPRTVKGEDLEDLRCRRGELVEVEQ
jgi:hypothetical protein